MLKDPFLSTAEGTRRQVRSSLECYSGIRHLHILGIIMALHLFLSEEESSSRRRLKLLAAYENGSVTLWGFSEGLGDMSVESNGWNEIWSSRIHVETGDFTWCQRSPCSMFMFFFSHGDGGNS